MKGIHLRTRLLAVGVIGSLVLAACGGSATSQSPAAAATSTAATASPSVAITAAAADAASPTVAANAVHLVVIGDSIPFAGFCPGCTGFVETYATALEAKTGRPVIVADRSRDDSAGIAQIKSQVADDDTLRTQITEADIVVVSIGYNNALPDPSTGVGCGGDMGQDLTSYVAWALAAKADCLQAGIDTYAADYDTIFSTIAGLRPDKPTARVALNAYDGNLSGLRAADVPKDTLAVAERWLVAAYDRWNAMECDRAVKAAFTCVDLYHAFNGADGTTTIPSDLTVDGTHPSQKGNDLIAELLEKVDLSAITQ